jgi:hypothetical protein
MNDRSEDTTGRAISVLNFQNTDFVGLHSQARMARLPAALRGSPRPGHFYSDYFCLFCVLRKAGGATILGDLRNEETPHVH